MRITEFEISEGTGIFNRSPSDPPWTATENNKFGAAPGTKFKFVEIKAYPEGGGAFETPIERDKALAAARQGVLIPSNIPSNTLLAFAIVTLQGEDGKKVKFIRYFQKINTTSPNKWKNDDLPGLVSGLAGSLKQKSGLVAKDLLASKFKFRNGAELMKYLQSLPTLNTDIKQGLAMINTGKFPIFQNSASNFEAIRDYLGEIIQALCLTKGMIKDDAANLAKQKLIDELVGSKTAWNQLAIEFPPKSTERLVDFYLTKDLQKGGEPATVKMGISSKGGKRGGGAAPSIVNLVDVYKKLSPRDLAKFKKKYKDADRLLQLKIDLDSGVKKPGPDSEPGSKSITKPVINKIARPVAVSILLPLKLAESYEALGVDEKRIAGILKLIRNNETNRANLTKWEMTQVQQYSAKIEGKQSWNFGYWILAKIARDVAIEFNKNPLNSEAFRFLLNRTAVMQCSTRAVLNPDNSVVINGIDSKFPLKPVGDVKLVSDRYRATGAPAGPFGFRW